MSNDLLALTAMAKRYADTLVRLVAAEVVVVAARDVWENNDARTMLAAGVTGHVRRDKALADALAAYDAATKDIP